MVSGPRRTGQGTPVVVCPLPWEGWRVEEHFGPYRLDELIGRGGMGEVHRAFDTVRKRTVALKRLRPALVADPEFQARFRAESELAARLRSAHVIPIHDYGEIDGRLYIDMRLVDGEDMGDRLAGRGPLAAADVVDVLGQIAGALDAAHAAGLVHRDVKPSNILLSPTDGVSGRDFAYLVDFGIARSADGTGALTGSGPIVGTVDYMAPERFERNSPDHRVDVYALACVMFEALTGSKPFVTDSLAGLLYSHLNAPPPRPSQRRPGVSSAFDAVIARGMAKDPDRRHPTAGALAAAARVALEAPAVPAPPVAVAGRRRRGRADAERDRDRPVASATADTVRLGARPAAPAGDAPAGDTPTGNTPTGDAPPGARPPGTGRRRGWFVAGGVGLVAAATVAGGALLVGPGALPALTAAASAPPVVRVGAVLPIDNASGLAVAPSGRYFLAGYTRTTPSGDLGQQLEAYAGASATPLGTAPLPEESVADLAVSADGSRLGVVGRTYSPTGDPHVTLSVFDPASTTPTADAVLPEPVTALALAPDGRRAYAVASDELLIIDTADAGVLSRVPLGADSRDVAVAPDGSRVLVSSSTGVKILDTARGTITDTIGLRDEPGAIAITPDGARAVVITSQNTALVTLDLESRGVLAAFDAGEQPSDVALTPDGAQALVTDENTGTLLGVNLADGSRFTLSVGDRPSRVALSPDGTFGLVLTSSNVVRLERTPA